MELTILGNYGPFPKAGTGACSGYLLKEDDSVLVMDMGPGTLSRLQKFIDIRKISAIFISHLHFDHTSDLLAFRYLLDTLQHTVTIYTRYEDSEWYRTLFSHSRLNVVNIDAGSAVNAGKFELSFLEMTHPVPCFGVIVKGSKTFFYTGDSTLNDNVFQGAEKSDWMLADCSQAEGTKAPHMNVDEAKAINEKTGVKIISSHLSPSFDPSDSYASYPDITVAEAEKTYIL